MTEAAVKRHPLKPAPAVACSAGMKKPERILRLGRWWVVLDSNQRPLH
jgi:hypothetical protein